MRALPWNRFCPPAVDTGTKASNAIQLRYVHGAMVENRRGEQHPGASEAGASPPERQPRRRHGQEVQRGLAGQHGRPPQHSGGQRVPRPPVAVRGQQPLERPPQQDEEDVLDPEVTGEPDQLGIKRGDRGRGQARLAPEGQRAHAPDGGDEQGRDHDLQRLRGRERARERVRPGQEVRVQGRVEDHLVGKGRRPLGHDARPFRPRPLVRDGRGRGLEHEQRGANDQPGEGQQEQGAPEGRVLALGVQRPRR